MELHIYPVLRLHMRAISDNRELRHALRRVLSVDDHPHTFPIVDDTSRRPQLIIPCRNLLDLAMASWYLIMTYRSLLYKIENLSVLTTAYEVLSLLITPYKCWSYDIVI